MVSETHVGADGCTGLQSWGRKNGLRAALSHALPTVKGGQSGGVAIFSKAHLDVTDLVVSGEG
eukprot:2078736-Alexandrium_andersonii.AAC.1